MSDLMQTKVRERLESRSGGALLGTFIGDVIGMPFEGATPTDVAQGLAVDVDSIAEHIRESFYTDDTQMMIGVAESLVTCRGFDAEHMARRFAENFDPARGYGGGAGAILSAIRQGAPYGEVARMVFPDGSYGNGAAMRAAPIGVMFHHNMVALRRAAEGSAGITHAHELGKEGAVLIAAAVGIALSSSPLIFDAANFLARLRDVLDGNLDIYAERLSAIEALLQREPWPEEIISLLGHDIRAHASVPSAIYSFLSHPNSFAEAVRYAVSLGGDTDTIGAMTGAIAGALHGLEGIPKSWVESLEQGEKGGAYVADLALQLIASHQELIAV